MSNGIFHIDFMRNSIGGEKDESEQPSENPPANPAALHSQRQQRLHHDLHATF